jgi:GIY-YIG catalytic domain-containing protein
MNQQQVDEYFTACEQALLDVTNRTAITFDKAFKISIPPEGGVYVIFFGGAPFYVGETTSIRQRLAGHMRNPENHVMALKLARLLHDQAHGVGTAGSTRKFSEIHKRATRTWIATNLQVAFLAMPIGRKELEERLIAKHTPEFNKRYPFVSTLCTLPNTTQQSTVERSAQGTALEVLLPHEIVPPSPPA